MTKDNLKNKITNSTNIALCPILGQTYFYFNDGKVRKSRREEVVITDVIPFDKIDNETLEVWKGEIERCDWGLYDPTTDFFVKGVLGKDRRELIFSRSKGGWFSFGNYFWDGRLCIDGSLNASLGGRNAVLSNN
jgi:hypothetical protein